MVRRFISNPYCRFDLTKEIDTPYRFVVCNDNCIYNTGSTIYTLYTNILHCY